MKRTVIPAAAKRSAGIHRKALGSTMDSGAASLGWLARNDCPICFVDFAPCPLKDNGKPCLERTLTMVKLAIGGAFMVLASADFCAALAACRIQGPSFFPTQNDKPIYTVIVNKTGCSHRYNASGRLMFEKAISMKQPTHGSLTQTGEFSFFYKPNQGFVGRDTYVIYICGSSLSGSGCSRLTYEATVR